jgi:hypothetical protein
LGLTVETPVTADLIVRGQISRMWGLTDSAGVPPVSHDLTLRHIAVDVVWPSRPVNSSGVTSYGEFGFGWYFYDDVGRRGTNGHAKGLHGGGGIEFPISGQRFTVNGEVQVHVMDLPPTNLAPVFVRLLGGMKVRF